MHIYLSLMNYLCMWTVFLLSNVVCNGIPYYLGSSSGSQARCESRDRRFWKIGSLWRVGSDSATGQHYSPFVRVTQLCNPPSPQAPAIYFILLQRLRRAKVWGTKFSVEIIDWLNMWTVNVSVGRSQEGRTIISMRCEIQHPPPTTTTTLMVF